MSEVFRQNNSHWDTTIMSRFNKLKVRSTFTMLLLHCKPGQVEPAYIECGNGAAAMQVSQVNLFEVIWVNFALCFSFEIFQKDALVDATLKQNQHKL